MKITIAYRGVLHAGWAIGESLAQAFIRLGHEVYLHANHYRTEYIIGSSPDNVDLLIYLECNDDEPQYYELSSLKCPKVYWEFDSAMHPDFMRSMQNVFEFDYVFCANKKYAKEYDAYYLPYAVDVDKFKPYPVQLKRGTALVGTAFKKRIEFCEQVGIPIITNTRFESYSLAVRRLKSHLHYYSSGGEDLLVCRIFETLGSATLLLAKRSDVLLDLFEENKHMLCYDSVDECVEKIEWINGSNEWRAIAQSGYEEVIAKHTYLHRAKEILSAVGVK